MMTVLEMRKLFFLFVKLSLMAMAMQTVFISGKAWAQYGYPTQQNTQEYVEDELDRVSGPMERLYLLRGGRIFTMTPLGILENGDILIRNGKVELVGSDLINSPLASKAEIIELRGKVVTPGLISAHNSLGLMEIELQAATRDDAASFYHAGFSVTNAFNHKSVTIGYTRAAGFTGAVVLPATQGHNPFSGMGSYYQLKDSSDSLQAKDIVLYSYFGNVGHSRSETLARLEDLIAEAKEYSNDKLGWKLKDSEQGAKVRDLEAILKLVRQEAKLMVESHREVDIVRLVEFAAKHQIQLLISGASEAYKVADMLADAKVSVVMDTTKNIPQNYDMLQASLFAPGILQKAGVKVLFRGPDTHNAYLARQAAAVAVSHGMDYMSALEGLTGSVADSFSLGAVGRLARGYVADVVVWNGDPLSVSSYPTLVFIAGKEQPLETRQQLLARRYMNKPVGVSNAYVEP